MSQPTYAEQDASSEVDPLLDFCAEQAETAKAVELDRRRSPETPEKSTQVEPVEWVEFADARKQEAAGLRQRLERSERTLERSLNEITALRAELATLVTAVEDIKKRQSRVQVPRPQAPQTTSRISRGRVVVAAVALVTVAAAAWGLTSIGSGPPAPIAVKPVTPPLVPAAVTDPSPQPIAIPPAAESVLPATPVRKTAPPPSAPARAAPKATAGYVGTLTIDASPGGEVFVDRQSVGRTPLRLEKLRAGSHLIWIEQQGYRRWTRVVAVTADRISRVSAELDPISR